MRYDQQRQRFRATVTDLANHARCDHLTHRAREHAVAVAAGTAQPIVREGLAIEKGRAFEAAYVAKRRATVEAAGGRFVDCSAAGEDHDARRRALEDAIRAGVQLVAQAPLRSGDLFGVADLLVRVGDAATPGGELGTVHRYEPVEVKYGRSLRPEYVLQATAYADALERLQGELPEHLHVVTGDEHEHPLRSADYVEYYRAARERFVEALAQDLAEALQPVPDPVAHCDGCDFAATCRERWTAVDHLSLVANIRTDQRAKLEAAGITTVAALAETQLDRVPKIGDSTFRRLVTQARLQVESRDGDPADTKVELRRPAPDEPPGRGFALLPEPDAEDMFFDFEGYPYHERGALEYLWGWTSHGPDGAPRFDHLWADTPAEEADAFTRFLDEVEARRERSGGRMHVYHYAPYEITALRRLAKEHEHEQARLDALLRAGTFVDLYAVVRQSMQVGRPSYSIKYLEPLYGISRDGDDLADGGTSIEVYEHWLNQRDPAVRDTIVAYNKVDCDSTLALRDWLLERRREATAAGITWPVAELPAPGDQADADDGGGDEDGDERAPTTRERLEAVADDAQRPDDVRLTARLLAAMPGWGRRVRREFFGDLYGRMHDRHPEDDVTDPNVLAMLELVVEDDAPPGGRAGTVDRTYSFPDQVHLLDVGADAIDPSVVVTVGTVRSIDHDACRVTIRTTRAQHDRMVASGLGSGWRPRSIVGWADFPTRPLEETARRVGEQLLATLDAGEDPFAPHQPHAAALSMLARHHTRVVDGPGPEALDHGMPSPADLADLVQRADGSHVIVQGPPGTGKTYTSARLVAELVARGMTIGITSNTHNAAIKVLEDIEKLRHELASHGRTLELRAAYALRTGERAPGTFGFGDDWIERPKTTSDAAHLLADGTVQVLAGTAWQLAKCEALDVVLVDEAGQVSLLHLTAMAACARRAVLVGDPQQLPQPSSAAHPHGCGASALEHVFEGEPVLPPDRAVLLPVTFRMHPRIAEFISRAYYLGELVAHGSTAEHRLVAPPPPLPDAGTHLLEVEHRGNRSHSAEEVDAIRDLVDALLDGGRVVADAAVGERDLRPSDILVVAPYNAQRRALQQALGPEIEVGTVDRFQGQQAAVAIVSMTASSREDLPRGLEFLLDPHRLNVAISRARALTVLVASPALLSTDAASLAELAMLNDLARYARASSRSSTSSSRS